MNKEIKIINYVFKYKGKISLISIEEYIGYQIDMKNLKLLIDEKYIEKQIYLTNHTPEKLVFDNFIITKSYIDIKLDNYKIKLNVDNVNLINEYLKVNKGKNNYYFTNNQKYNGIINDEEVSDIILADYESITNILDDYYKIYCLDFAEYLGCFNMVIYDNKTPHIYLKYKDEEFFNKKILNVHKFKFFKLTKYKFTSSGNFYCKINISVKKMFKSNPSIIPFKYQKGIVYLKMKKNLFKTNLRTTSNQILLINYKYI